MRLLFITQAVDRDNSVLGFVHGWLRAFSAKFERIVAICLEEGNFSFGENVSVLSLGKEKGIPRYFKRLRYTLRFLGIIHRENKNYDVVFIHMNPEYVLLGYPIWKFSRKKIFLWYNHGKAGPIARMAFRLVDGLFYTSPFAASSHRPNSRRMPAGIDTDLFAGGISALPRSTLFLGRLAPVKKVEILIEAALKLSERGGAFKVSIYGDPTPNDSKYALALKKKAGSLTDKNFMEFYRAVSNRETPAIFSAHEIFVNLTPAGAYDKTVLEAAASGAIPVVSSPAFKDLLPADLFFKEGDAASLACKLEEVWDWPEEKKKETRMILRERVLKNHSLNCLVEEITSVLKN